MVPGLRLCAVIGIAFSLECDLGNCLQYCDPELLRNYVVLEVFVKLLMKKVRMLKKTLMLLKEESSMLRIFLIQPDS